MKAPFPFFGGKSMIAPIVWQALGQPEAYYEPFFGSGAVLLARPNYDPQKHTETVCDKDAFICNVWRSLIFSKGETAKWCDWPVNHADLMARKAELIRNEDRLLEGLVSDPKWHDPILAGYWIWAASCWIGSGLTRAGQIPHLSNKGMGVHAASRPPIYDWFDALSARLRHIRVVCGDWSRICGGDWQDKSWATVGYFFDPPYGVQDRGAGLYHQDSLTVSADVRAWCRERGKRTNYRIVLAGYEGEGHEELKAEGWMVKEWKTGQGYANTARNKETIQGKENSKRERLWFSPHCQPVQKQMRLI